MLDDGTCRIVVGDDLAGARERIARQPFDLILCDYWMREIDGIGFIRQLGPLQRPAVKVLVAGYPIGATPSDFRRAGIDHVVPASEACQFMGRLTKRPVPDPDRRAGGTADTCERYAFPCVGGTR